MQRTFYSILLIWAAAMIGIPVIAQNSLPTANDMTIATDSIVTDSIPAPPDSAVMLLDLESYHLGLIKDYTKPTTYTFFYCNGGTEGLIIKRIEATCGCKILQYPTDSIGYDQSGSILVEVMPCKDAGSFKKAIYLYTNAGTFRLQLTGIFNQGATAHEDYSAIPTEEEEMQQVLLIDESTNRGIDESKKKEKSNKKEKRKKKNQPNHRLVD